MKVNEIFYSLQGEGARVGSPNIFIRLSECPVQKSCERSGVDCDTEFESGREMSVEEIRAEIVTTYPPTTAKSIIWTGGEPAYQLTDEIVEYFKALGFYQAIETSGGFTVPTGVDWVCVSPKVAEHIIEKNFAGRRENFETDIDEIKYVRAVGQSIPNPKVTAKYRFISPHFTGGVTLEPETLEFCVDLVKTNPEWRLSVQQHKFWGVR